MAFYRKAVNAHIESVMHYHDSPEPMPPGMLAPGFEYKVMHAHFHIGSTVVMASDGISPDSKFDGFSLAMSVGTEAEAERAFHALAEGGQVVMPLMKTWWSPLYGMLADQFGVNWMIMVTDAPPEPTTQVSFTEVDAL